MSTNRNASAESYNVSVGKDVAIDSNRKIPVGRRSKGPETNPVIQVEKEGDQITRIELTCGCGEVITIHCSYPSDGH